MDPKFDEMLTILEKHTSTMHTPLDDLQKVRGKDIFRTLIQTILTAQTKDSTTAPVSRRLFKIIGSRPEDIASASIEELEEIIHSITYYKTKAKHIKATARRIKDDFNGRVPITLSELVTLPGVGPKTAKIILADVLGEPYIAVDIHVHRISNRIGLISTKTREQSDKELEKIVPLKWKRVYNTIMVKHGQTTCKSRVPHCSQCPVKHLCPQIDTSGLK